MTLQKRKGNELFDKIFFWVVVSLPALPLTVWVKKSAYLETSSNSRKKSFVLSAGAEIGRAKGTLFLQLCKRQKL